MSQAKYDEALFRQLLEKRKASDGTICLEDIEECFRIVAVDVVSQIDAGDLSEYLCEEVIPDLAKTLSDEGWRIAQYQ